MIPVFRLTYVLFLKERGYLPKFGPPPFSALKRSEFSVAFASMTEESARTTYSSGQNESKFSPNARGK